MKNILALLPRPSHYLGTEEGSVHKDLSTVQLHFALAFPDLYEVGMSYLGQKILYHIINSREGFFAERVFAPCKDAGDILKKHKEPLSTLESDTPLSKTHMIGFSITHELCFTNILYMLDLAGIPLYSEQRTDSLTTWPIIVAGGGCTIGSEPITPFIDIMILGEGEEVIIELAECLVEARSANLTRSQFFKKAMNIPGVYIPSFFHAQTYAPLVENMPTPGRRIVADFDATPYPENQVVPFGSVHNRLSIEIARGCTRSCRFCQAGMLYRPARERKLDTIKNILEKCLNTTGFDDVSFLSLSTGDFSALKTLFLHTIDRCAQEQISVSLPSLRIGSIDEEIMQHIASIRRTGATLAPEAGSQRMRDIINKGITEESIVLHTKKLSEHGWQQVKLYFMIGLPKETLADLDAIIDLCKKVRNTSAHGTQKLQVTASISPFVPKPHTPFQWEPQIPLTEIKSRIHYLHTAFKKEKGLKLRWHEPEMSHLEGILARGDRKLSKVIELAYKKGAIFTSWIESFQLSPWIEAFQEVQIDHEAYLTNRDINAPLPWDHLNAGISKKFLHKELARAFKETITLDCRYAPCKYCGSCDTKNTESLIPRAPNSVSQHKNYLNFPQRDQDEHTIIPSKIVPQPSTSSKYVPPDIPKHLTHKAVRYKISHTKTGLAMYLSQLELQTIFARAMRKASIPMCFSQGFHPLPLLSFSRALPIGVESLSEWVSITLREHLTAQQVTESLAPHMPIGMHIISVDLVPFNEKRIDPQKECFMVQFTGDKKDYSMFSQSWEKFTISDSFVLTRVTKKGPRTNDIRPLFEKIHYDLEKNCVFIDMNWEHGYISPLKLVQSVTPWASLTSLQLTKIA